MKRPALVVLATVAAAAMAMETPAPCTPWNCASEETPQIIAFTGRDTDAADAFEAGHESEWIQDAGDSKVLLLDAGRAVVKRARLSRTTGMFEFWAIDGVGSGITLPEELPVRIDAGEVAHVRGLPERDLNDNSALALRAHTGLTAGVAMRCKDSADGSRWCAVAAHDGTFAQTIYMGEGPSGGRGFWRSSALWFAGDLDRDGRIDLVFENVWYGAAPCTGHELYLSGLRVPGKTGWGLAASGASCI